MKKGLGQEGQAALTDALYFLLIVSALSTFLFFFAANYGLTVQQRVVSQYWRAYATSALETILYSSTPRISGQALDQADEVDYLLAAVKEDFADDSEIDETRGVLAQNIKGIMQPLAGNFDYLFYLYLSDTKEFAFVMLYTREAPEITDGKVSPGDAKIFFCKPKTLDDLEGLVESVGSSAQSNARIQLIELDESGNASYPIAQASLTMWVPTPLEQMLPGLECELHETIEAQAA
jgi:hypothetical protein